jgi:GT2 family glycosyltransferase
MTPRALRDVRRRANELRRVIETGMTQDAQRIHVIVAPRGGGEWLEPCLGAVMAQSQEDIQVTVLEDAATRARPALEQLSRRFSTARRMPVPRGMGLAAATNRAAALVRDARFVLLLDPEAILALDAVKRLREALVARPTAAVIGCKVLDGDVETIHHIGLRLRGNGLPTAIGQGELDRGQFRGLQEALTLQVGALLIRAEAWCELGGLDERFEAGFYERIDFCLRCWQANWSITVAGDATATHFGLADGQAFHPGEGEAFFMSRARFLQKHYRFGDWISRWLPDELRWWRGGGDDTVKPHRVRWLALRTLLKAARTPLPQPPPVDLRTGRGH